MDKEYIILDFDETLYYKDSLVAFHLYCIGKNPLLICWIPFQLLGYLLHKVNFISTQQFKNIFLLFFAFQSVRKIQQRAAAFWDREYPSSFQPTLLSLMEQAPEHIVIITASPVLYIEPLLNKLPNHTLIGTNLKRRAGLYIIDGQNCKGIEKVIRFKQQFGKDSRVVQSYSDHLSDVPILQLATEGFIVKRDRITRYEQ
jgi:phosphoserine phosphatase